MHLLRGRLEQGAGSGRVQVLGNVGLVVGRRRDGSGGIRAHRVIPEKTRVQGGFVVLTGHGKRVFVVWFQKWHAKVVRFELFQEFGFGPVGNHVRFARDTIGQALDDLLRGQFAGFQNALQTQRRDDSCGFVPRSVVVVLWVAVWLFGSMGHGFGGRRRF